MRSIFNKKVVKKCNLWDHKQYIYILFTVGKVNNYILKKKKKKNVDVVSAQNKQSDGVNLSLPILKIIGD